jgi:hypothetical protein
MLMDYLKSNYKEGEPIFTDDIHIDGVNRPNLIQQLKTLSDNGKIIRIEKGIYYMPSKTRFGSSAGPAPETIARYKYISRNGKTDGYYSGNTFANMIGISTQVPMKKEIVSNNVAAIVKHILIGQQAFVLRKSNVPITNENVRTLQLLELLKNLDDHIDIDRNEAREKLTYFIDKNQITKKGVDQYIREYPDSTFRFYYEMRLDDVLT